MSIDLSHHVDGAEESNDGAQLVSHFNFRNTLLSCDALSSDLTRRSFFFPPPPRTTYSYRCLDARFYDDEMLTVVLERLEEEDRSRVLAQVPLASALSCETEFTWDPKLRCVCLSLELW